MLSRGRSISAFPMGSIALFGNAVLCWGVTLLDVLSSSVSHLDILELHVSPSWCTHLFDVEVIAWVRLWLWGAVQVSSGVLALLSSSSGRSYV